MSHPSTSTHLEASALPTERILEAAKLLFDARGYSAVTIEEISSQSGVDSSTITGAYPTTYELFRECSLGDARRLLASTDGSLGQPADSRQARTLLVATLESLARAAIATRTDGNFMRGQTRYLTPADQSELRSIADQLHGRIQRLVQLMRPHLDDVDAQILAVAAVGTITSVTTHPTTLPNPKIQTLLTVSAMRMIESECALTAPTAAFGPRQAPAWMSDDSTLGQIIAAAITLIYTRGFGAVTLADVADASGTPLATVTRYFDSTADLLYAAFGAGGDALRTELVRAAAGAGTRPRDILHALSHAYVDHFFGNPELMTVFILDAHHLPPQHQQGALALHQEFMTGWLECLGAIRPELTQSEASFLVYAGLSIVFDVGGMTRWKHDARVMAAVERLIVTTLIGGR